MNKSELEVFEKKLAQKRDQLVNVVQRSESYGREIDSDGDAMDLADKASNSYTKEFMFSKSNSDRMFLQQVDEALLRIKSGTFGECVRCEDPIERKRLEAIPWARLCLACQEKAEKS